MIKLVKTEHIKSYEKGPIRRSLFSNGAVSLFHQFKSMNCAVVNLYFLAGSIFESEKNHGLAHVIEHMLFKEGENGSLLKELEVNGAIVNAYTYKEYVCFELECLSSRLEEFLPKFFALFFSPTFIEKDLRIEKKVIIQEIKEDKDDHETEGLEILFAKHFKRPLGHPIAGQIKNVNSFKIKDLKSYYKNFFTPDRMILSVVSGKKQDKLESIFMSSMPEQMDIKKTPFRLFPTKNFGKVNHFNSYLPRKMENCVVYYAFDGLALEHKNYYDLTILDDLLFEGLTSKFFLRLREELGIIYGLGSSINSFATTGNYVLVFNTQKKYLKLLDQEVKKVFDHYTDIGFTHDEIKRSKQRIIDGINMSFDDMQERSEFFAIEEIYNTHDFSYKSLKKQMADVTSSSIMSFVKNMKKRGMTRLVLGPK